MSQSLKPLAVVLDSYPLDKGDVAWDGIAGLVNLTHATIRLCLHKSLNASRMRKSC